MPFDDPDRTLDETDHEPYERPGGRGLRYTPVPRGNDGDGQSADEATRIAREARRYRTDG